MKVLSSNGSVLKLLPTGMGARPTIQIALNFAAAKSQIAGSGIACNDNGKNVAPSAGALTKCFRATRTQRATAKDGIVLAPKDLWASSANFTMSVSESPTYNVRMGARF